MARKAIPRVIRDAVLREYNHRCAICGEANPHIHHIDGDHDNNTPENLLPLCPNCHLLDQHNPTANLDHRKLRLFRKYKDPLILSAQFEPLFKRLTFLLNLTQAGFDIKQMAMRADELVQFVTQLEMGSFYGPQFKSLIGRRIHARVYTEGTPDSVFRQWAEEESTEYFEKLNKGQSRVLELAVELLRYQPWMLADRTRR
jgi:hypothetical protein